MGKVLGTETMGLGNDAGLGSRSPDSWELPGGAALLSLIAVTTPNRIGLG